VGEGRRVTVRLVLNNGAWNTGAGMDLTVHSASINNVAPVAGDHIVPSAVIGNDGTAASTAGVVHGLAFEFDGVKQLWSDTSTTSLAAGATRTLTANSGPAGVNYWVATAGSHTMRVWVDDANRFPAEVRKDNNTLDLVFTVGPGATTGTPGSLKAGSYVEGPTNQAIAIWQTFANATGTPNLAMMRYPIDSHTASQADLGTSMGAELDMAATFLNADSRRVVEFSIPLLMSDQVRQWYNTSNDIPHGQFATQIESRGISSRVFIRLGWEMNSPFGRPDNPASYSDADVNDAAAGYKAMWRRLRVQYKTHAPTIRMTWCPDHFDDASSGPRYPGNFWPGDDDQVDVVDMDAYARYSTTDPASNWAIHLPHLQRQAQFAIDHGNLPLGASEWGLWQTTDPSNIVGTGDDPLFIRNQADWFASHPYVLSLYFDSSGNASDRVLTVTAAPNALAAYRQKFAGYNA
jgi:hypothetical protein